MTITVDSSGMVECAEVFAATLSTELRLRPFSFDSQSRATIIRPLPSPSQPVRLVADPASSGSSVELAQWKQLGLEVSTPTSITVKNALPLTEVKFDLRVERRYEFYIWKVFVPLVVMVMISSTGLWIRLDDHYSQMTVALTTILTLSRSPFRFRHRCLGSHISISSTPSF